MSRPEKELKSKNVGFRNRLRWVVVVSVFFSGACASGTHLHYSEQESGAVVVDSLVMPDEEIAAIIAPYRESLTHEMNEIVGYAAKELTKGEVESTLGNFVADLTEEKAEAYAGFDIDMGAVTIGGLRVPIPEGPVRLRDMYELMPFENMVWVLELNGEQALQLFRYAAGQKTLALSGSEIVVENGEPVFIEVNGQPFDPERKYTLAISDYLANGGDQMSFLKDAKRLLKLDVKYRDIIIEKVADLEAAGEKVDAEIEGRIIVKE